MVLFVFQFYPVCNFEKFVNFGLGAVRSERVKTTKTTRMQVRSKGAKRVKNARGMMDNIVMFQNGATQ